MKIRIPFLTRLLEIKEEQMKIEIMKLKNLKQIYLILEEIRDQPDY